MKGLSERTVRFIIDKAREASDLPRDPDEDPRSDRARDEAPHWPDEESTPRAEALAEVRAAIDDLNDDEQAALVALVWVGRGTYEPDDWDEAVAQARAERVNKTSAYLTGVPMLAEHLESGLDAFVDVEDED